MDRKEIVNSQDYKATKAALEWWRNNVCKPNAYSEDRSESINLEDAYAEGVLYGWNNPDWISVEDEQPPKTTDWANPKYFIGSTEEGGIHKMYRMGDPTICKDFENEQLYLHVTHWMQLPQPPIKEDKE